MPQQDTSNIKDKIMSILRRRGPSLPVHVAKEIETSILFSSAFLSELVSEQKIKISNMKVGGSPIYYITGQEPLLERYSQHLKSKEKDAFNLLRDKKFLLDKNQEPAIRVALRSIRDFAIPFKREDEIFWRYFKVLESEFTPPKKIIQKAPIQVKPKITKEKQKDLDIFDKEKSKPQKPIPKKTIIKKKKTIIANEKFFNKVKEFLAKKRIEIIDIVGFSKSDLTLRVRDFAGEKILIAYNKRRVSDSDILRAYKKGLEFGLQYIILSLGEPGKKMQDFIKATKNLSSIEKM